MGLIQYRLPDDLHREAKAAAAGQGITLKAFLLVAIKAAVDTSKGKR